MYKFIFVSVAFCSLFTISYAQKKYEFEISLTGSAFDRKNLEIRFYQGYQNIAVNTNLANVINESQCSLLAYPVLEIFYYSPIHKRTSYRFFLKKQSSKIEVKYDPHTDDITVPKKEGVLDFLDAGQEKFEIYAKSEYLSINNFSEKYDYDFSNLDSITIRQFDIYNEKLRDRQMEFVIKNPDLLFSVWLFMNEVIRDPRFSNEYLNSVYDGQLKPLYKNIFEGKYIAEKINQNRLGINTPAPARDLQFVDLAGNTQTIKSFKGKLLLVNIWATWCVPCVAEIPTLRNFYSQYKGELEIVSFSTDTEEVKLRNFVSLNNMNWINIHNRRDMSQIYGSDIGLPQLYLIDRDGTIIYSRTKNEDYELKKLEEILKDILVRK
ncbi:MAG: TlpA family protein disulfide reductase [Ferruginibacter sp.]|nr:TlpA family protein disulfide reductase [Ferruginibacter sp.]